MKTPSPIVVTVCIVGIVFAAIGLYMGALLPFLKSEKYIDAQNQVGSVHSVSDFEADFDNVYNFYSPVGTEEVTKFLAGDILNILGSDQSQPVASALVSYIEPHVIPQDVQQLLLMGEMYQTLWQDYGQESDYQKAIDYYSQARAIGPELPPPLYSLLGLYVAHDDVANTQATAKTILALWPSDTKVQALLLK